MASASRSNPSSNMINSKTIALPRLHFLAGLNDINSFHILLIKKCLQWSRLTVTSLLWSLVFDPANSLQAGSLVWVAYRRQKRGAATESWCEEWGRLSFAAFACDTLPKHVRLLRGYPAKRPYIFSYNKAPCCHLVNTATDYILKSQPV